MVLKNCGPGEWEAMVRDSRGRPGGGPVIALAMAQPVDERDDDGDDADDADDADLILADVLVEDVSIDGMCGVY